MQGLPEIERIFRHMYVALDQPHFVITGQLVEAPVEAVNADVADLWASDAATAARYLAEGTYTVSASAASLAAQAETVVKGVRLREEEKAATRCLLLDQDLAEEGGVPLVFAGASAHRNIAPTDYFETFFGG